MSHCQRFSQFGVRIAKPFLNNTGGNRFHLDRLKVRCLSHVYFNQNIIIFGRSTHFLCQVPIFHLHIWWCIPKMRLVFKNRTSLRCQESPCVICNKKIIIQYCNLRNIQSKKNSALTTVDVMTTKLLIAHFGPISQMNDQNAILRTWQWNYTQCDHWQHIENLHVHIHYQYFCWMMNPKNVADSNLFAECRNFYPWYIKNKEEFIWMTWVHLINLVKKCILM